MGITVIGSLNFDLVTYTKRIPDPGETFKADHFETHVGGKGLNQAVAIAKLRATPRSKEKGKDDADDDSDLDNYSVRLVGTVGNDFFGEQLLEYLRNHRVDTSMVTVASDDGVKTGTATILVDGETGQNRILVSEGANGLTVPDDAQLSQIFPSNLTERGEMVVFQHEIPDPVAIMHWIRKNRPLFKIVYNPSPFHPLPAEAWRLVDVLVVNEIESRQILESVEFEGKTVESMRALSAEIDSDFVTAYKHVCETLQGSLMRREPGVSVIITLGDKGVVYGSFSDDDGDSDITVHYEPAITNVNVVDTTGAGDTFLGGLVTQLYQGVPLGRAVPFSCQASTLTIQKRGAAESIPNYSDVCRVQAGRV